MSYYRGQQQQQRGRYDYNAAYANNNNVYQQGVQQQQPYNDDRNYYRAGGGRQQQQAYAQPQQYTREQTRTYGRPSPPPPKSPRTEAKDILDDVRSSKEQKAKAFKTLLDSARAAPHSTRSVLALTTAFPLFASDQQEEVIDFVYDLCEDPEPAVRIQGYKTIVELSKAVPSWTRRNTDVLVQLLQSDSPEELRVIRDALVAHIRTDPVAAIEVIMEHMVRAGQAEEKAGEPSAGGMKRLVLQFLRTPDVMDALRAKLAAGSAAENALNQGVSEAMLSATSAEAGQLVSLLQQFPSWFSDRRPNPFRTPAINALLDRIVAVYRKPGKTDLNEIMGLWTIAQRAADDGRGDPRAFLRFWARMSWDKWTAGLIPTVGPPDAVKGWIKASMGIWDTLRRENKDDDPMYEEATLAGQVSAVVVQIIHHIAETFGRDGPASQQTMWPFLDSMLDCLNLLVQTPMDPQHLRDAFTSEPIYKLLRFAYETKDVRGSGLKPESVRMLKSIASKSDVLYADLGVPPPVSNSSSAVHRISTPASTAGVKRNSEGLQVAGAAGKRPPVKIDRDRPGNREPPKGPMSMMRNHLRAAEASPVPSRTDVPSPRRDLLTPSKPDPTEDRPIKRPRLSVENAADKPTRATSLLDRINGGNSLKRTTSPNGTHPAKNDGSQGRSLAERLGVEVKGGATRHGKAEKPEDPITIRGAAGLASRLSRPASSTSLLSRIAP